MAKSVRPGKARGKGKKSVRRFFKHYRNGKTYDAWKYGHKGWPIG